MVRHYESFGLLPKIARTDSGYRQYEDRDVHTLRFIRRGHDLDFSMVEIANLLKLWQNRRRASADVKRIALAHVADLDRRMAEMAAMKKTLENLADCCRGDDRPDRGGPANSNTGMSGNSATTKRAKRPGKPSRTASTMVAKLSLARIIRAASLVTSVPLIPIATPMSAAFSAGASLTPSPVIATMLPSGKPVDVGEHLGPGRVVEGHHVHADTLPIAALQQKIGGTFGDDDQPIAVLVIALDRRHHFAFRAERDFGDLLEAPLPPLADAELALGDEKGSFRRVSLDLPLAVRALAQAGVARQAAAAENDDVLGAHRPRQQGVALQLEPAVRRVSHTHDTGLAGGRARRPAGHPLGRAGTGRAAHGAQARRRQAAVVGREP